MRKLERQLRLTTGLIVASFVLLHFLNHALGVVSVDAMDSMRGIITRWCGVRSARCCCTDRLGRTFSLP